jgi:hypothetical protein
VEAKSNAPISGPYRRARACESFDRCDTQGTGPETDRVNTRRAAAGRLCCASATAPIEPTGPKYPTLSENGARFLSL